MCLGRKLIANIFFSNHDSDTENYYLCINFYKAKETELPWYDKKCYTNLLSDKLVVLSLITPGRIKKGERVSISLNAIFSLFFFFQWNWHLAF